MILILSLIIYHIVFKKKREKWEKTQVEASGQGDWDRDEAFLWSRKIFPCTSGKKGVYGAQRGPPVSLEKPMSQVWQESSKMVSEYSYFADKDKDHLSSGHMSD